MTTALALSTAQNEIDGLDRVVGEDDDAIAARDAASDERVRERVRARVELRVGEPLRLRQTSATLSGSRARGAVEEVVQHAVAGWLRDSWSFALLVRRPIEPVDDRLGDGLSIVVGGLR